jgi:Fe-S-cluster containining protein
VTIGTMKLLLALAAKQRLPEKIAAMRRGDCPFLQGGSCGVHWARPLGCRAYFCDGEGDGWQEALLESWHGRVRTLHESLALPYRYDEWRRLLRDFAAGRVG